MSLENPRPTTNGWRERNSLYLAAVKLRAPRRGNGGEIETSDNGSRGNGKSWTSFISAVLVSVASAVGIQFIIQFRWSGVVDEKMHGYDLSIAEIKSDANLQENRFNLLSNSINRLDTPLAKKVEAIDVTINLLKDAANSLDGRVRSIRDIIDSRQHLIARAEKGLEELAVAKQQLDDLRKREKEISEQLRGIELVIRRNDNSKQRRRTTDD